MSEEAAKRNLADTIPKAITAIDRATAKRVTTKFIWVHSNKLSILRGAAKNPQASERIDLLKAGCGSP